MIRYTCSEVPIWIKWFAIRAPKSRSELNDSRYVLRSPDLNQMIRYTCSEVPIWIKWFAIRAPKSRSELNDSLYVLRSPDLNQMIRDTCSVRSPDLNWDYSEFWKAQFHPSLRAFSRMNGSFEQFFLLVNRSKWSMSRVWVWINRSGSSVNDSLNWIGCSVHPFSCLQPCLQYYYWISSLVYEIIWKYCMMFTNKISIFPLDNWLVSTSKTSQIYEQVSENFELHLKIHVRWKH